MFPTIPSALRVMIRHPGLASARLVTVAAVVAALASVTAIASATLFRRLPFPDADRLIQVALLPVTATDINAASPLFPVAFHHLGARGPSIEAVSGIWRADRAIVGGNGEPDSLPAGRVGAQFFSMLGATTVVGRVFTDDEVAADAALVVLSHGLWTRMFGADAGVVGTVIQIDRQPYTVIGVTGRDFEPAFTATQFWTPLRIQSPSAVRATVVQTIGRLRAGATPAAAEAELQPVLDAAVADLPDLMRGYRMTARDLRESRFGARRNALLVMLVIVAGLGLIATANLANLTLADLGFRLPDFALRSALGGSTRAIVMAELIPCVILAMAGSAIGLTAAAAATPWMLALDPALGAAGLTISIDWRVAAVSGVASLLVMGAAVVIPSWRVARRDHVTFLTGTRLTDARSGRLSALLVAAQSACAVILLSSAALVATTLQRTAALNPGFDPSSVVAGQLRLAENTFRDHETRVRFIRSVLDRLRVTPGVVGAGTTLNPFVPGGSFTTNLTVEEVPSPDGLPYTTQFRRVSPGYFEAMRIRVLRGRTFRDTDTDTAPMVAVVSDALARRYWPAGDALGKRIRRGAATLPWLEIVGVVDDVRDAGLTFDTGPVMYTTYYQGSTTATPAGLVVRTTGDPRAAIPAIRQAVWDVDPAQPLSNLVVLDEFLESSLGPQQFRAWLVAVCGVCGMLLAVVGIYGVTSRAVSERAREIGIRIALGGQPSRVWWRQVTRSLSAVIAGVAAGTFGASVVDGGLAHLLPELGGSGWEVRIGASALMIAAGAAAAMIAARHAATISPIRALRGD